MHFTSTLEESERSGQLHSSAALPSLECTSRQESPACWELNLVTQFIALYGQVSQEMDVELP